MKTFKDLEFKDKFSKEVIALMPNLSDAIQAFMSFDNGYGISVISGYGSYSSKSEPYEVAVFKGDEICYSTHITDDVIGYQTEEGVTEIMKQIQEL